MAETPLKVEVAKEEGVANFRRSYKYKKEILEAICGGWWVGFTKLLLVIPMGLLVQGASPAVILSTHKSLEAVVHTIP